MSEPKGIHAAMVAVMRDVEPIGLTTKKGITFKFRSIQDVYGAVHDILHKNKVHCVTANIEPIDAPEGFVGRVYTFRFYHEDGSYVDTKGEGAGVVQNRYDDKYPGKAQSYADKYALISALKIPLPDLEDNDSVPAPNGNGYKSAQPPKETKPIELPKKFDPKDTPLGRQLQAMSISDEQKREAWSRLIVLAGEAGKSDVHVYVDSLLKSGVNLEEKINNILK